LRFWILFVVLAPALAVQALRTRRNALRLPERVPHGSRGRAGEAGGGSLTLLIAGESTAVGVGVDEAAQSVGVQLAHRLSERYGLRVEWAVTGRNGATAADVEALLAGDPPAAGAGPKVALVLLGVNNVTSLSSVSRWRRDLARIHQRLRDAGCNHVFFASVPPIGQFVLLPQPLRTLLGLRADRLQRAMAAHFERVAGTTVIHTEFPNDPALLAADGYHPSAAACRLWSERLAAEIPAAAIGISPGRATRAG
jgi:lysophospholipase L1-like esterase